MSTSTWYRIEDRRQSSTSRKERITSAVYESQTDVTYASSLLLLRAAAVVLVRLFVRGVRSFEPAQNSKIVFLCHPTTGICLSDGG